MSRCRGITIRGNSCKNVVLVGNRCSGHQAEMNQRAAQRAVIIKSNKQINRKKNLVFTPGNTQVTKK